MDLPSLNELEEWVAQADFSWVPQGAEADAALDLQDRPEIEEPWLAAAAVLDARIRTEGLSEKMRALIDKLAEDAFVRVFEASEGHHDLSAQVSDEVELVAQASVLGHVSPYISNLWQQYRTGGRQIGQPVSE